MGVCSSDEKEATAVPGPEATYKNCTRFVVPITTGRIIKVYDGDSFWVAAYLKGDLYKFAIRLKGVDTPEMKASADHEKELARMAKKFVMDKIIGQVVAITGNAHEKYGRLLCNVSRDGEDIADALVARKLARRYDGGTKHKWTMEDLVAAKEYAAKC